MQTWRYKSFHKQPDSWSWDFRCKEIVLEKQKKMCKHYLLTVQLHRLFIPTIVMYIFTNWEMNFRSLKVFYRKCVLRNFAKFTGKHLCQSLFFNKVAGNRPVPECFPMNFSKFLKAPFFFTELFRWLVLCLLVWPCFFYHDFVILCWGFRSCQKLSRLSLFLLNNGYTESRHIWLTCSSFRSDFSSKFTEPISFLNPL